MRYLAPCARPGLTGTLCQPNSTHRSERFSFGPFCDDCRLSLYFFTFCLRDLISQEGANNEAQVTTWIWLGACAATSGNDHVPRSDKNGCTPISVCSGAKPVDSNVAACSSLLPTACGVGISKPSRRPTVPGRGSRHSCSHCRLYVFRPPHTVGNNLT